MNLENFYKKTKKKNTVLFDNTVTIVAMLALLGCIAGVVVITQFVWNFVAPVWGLPQLSYLQALGTIALIHIIKVIFFGLDIQRVSNQNSILIKTLERPIDENNTSDG